MDLSANLLYLFLYQFSLKLNKSFLGNNSIEMNNKKKKKSFNDLLDV
jgi:hypothetical protein